MRHQPLIPASRGIAALMLMAIFSIALPRLAEAIDTSKLKKGDKVEVNIFDEWQPGTVIEVIQNGWVWVRTDEIDRHLYTPKNIRLLGDAGDPFATEEEKSDKQVLRLWTDSTGKHKVEATLVRHEAGKVVLKRKDGKEVVLPFSRLSDTDQQFLAGNGSDDAEESDESIESDIADKTIELSETDLSRASPADVSIGGAWQYKPDAATESTSSLSKVRIPLGNKGDFFENPTGLLLAPDKNKAVAILLNTHPGADDYVARVVDCDLTSKKVGAVAQFVGGEEPIDLSSDARLVLARSAGFGFGKQARLTIYSLEGKEVTPVVAWQPYGEEDDHDSDIRWARFVGPHQVLAISEEGVLSLWKTDELAPLWMAKGARDAYPGLSATQKTVALPVEGGVVLLETSSGRKLGSLGAEPAHARAELAALDTLGTRLALVNPGRCRVWELSDQKLVREFPLPARLKCETLVWCGPEHLLVDGHCLVDVTRRLWAWDYEEVSPAVRAHGPQTWYITGGGRQNAMVLCSATLPDEAARAATSGLEAESLLVIKPGMKVSLDLQINAAPDDRQKVQAALTSQLTKSGLVVEEGSPLKLSCSIRPGETEAIQYREFGKFDSTSHSATSEILEIAFVLNDEKVWKYESKTSPPHLLSLNQGEDVNSALQRVMRQDPAAIASIWLPGYVAKSPLAAPYGTSPEPAGR
ncbi:MAG: hypothetical protein KF708_18940 [Pirellulales bacterium]|nr:hypothetical protein [Pirellulales bacterium]